jgi:hypothetical protein
MPPGSSCALWMFDLSGADGYTPDALLEFGTIVGTYTRSGSPDELVTAEAVTAYLQNVVDGALKAFDALAVAGGVGDTVRLDWARLAALRLAEDD